MHPGRSLALTDGGITHLIWGQLDPRVAGMWELPDETFIAEIDLVSWHRAAQTVKIAPPPRYPAARRDLAVVVSETTRYADVEAAIRSAAGRELESLGLLDVPVSCLPILVFGARLLWRMRKQEKSAAQESVLSPEAALA